VADKKIPFKQEEGGYRYFLSNDVEMFVKWHSEKALQVEFSRKDVMVPPDTGNLYAASFRKRLVEEAGKTMFPLPEIDIPTTQEEARRAEEAIKKAEAERKPKLKTLEQELGEVAILLNTPTGGGQTLRSSLLGLSKGNEKSVTEMLIEYAQAKATFFHTPDRKAYAAVDVEGHDQNYRIDRADFADWVLGEYWSREEERLSEKQQALDGPMHVPGNEPLPAVVRDRDMKDSIRQLSALAMFRGEEVPAVYRRIGKHEDALYLDMCDSEWRQIEVTRDGWRMVEGSTSPVKFSRMPGMLPFPEPESGGSLAPLRNLLHLGKDKEEERNWLLIVAWLVQALTTDGAYTILSFLGNQGASKSSTQGVIRNIVDPNYVPIRKKPREVRDLFIAASNSWCVSLDNMSRVPEWISEALCIIVYHGAFAVRQNYEDEDEVLFKARRPALINGIGDILTFPDLLDRAAIVRIPPFETDPDAQRLADDEVDAEAKRFGPQVFGALLDLVVEYLNRKPTIENPDTRMVAYAKVGIAVEAALREKGEEFEIGFMDAYLVSRGEADEIALEAFPVASVLIRYAKGFPKRDPWEGTVEELLDDLNGMAGESLRRSDGWPTNPRMLGQQLDALQTNLLGAQVTMEKLPRGHGGIRRRRMYFGK
jgi:hypothetical protein